VEFDPAVAMMPPSRLFVDAFEFNHAKDIAD